ncbi:phytanoyl-CoA dioxygenase family protein [Nitzschia inconspicua]|uniref:Phytanoyl-CoA dioxygenase family protein n=1 Tax=Nitzschia inconspicua TaxID=303405 RepID=A0A9K3LJA1_9STRA|nr:phytanoyl-CoA dioxygenase family protein [Nitzschia inconspicua]
MERKLDQAQGLSDGRMDDYFQQKQSNQQYHRCPCHRHQFWYDSAYSFRSHVIAFFLISCLISIVTTCSLVVFSHPLTINGNDDSTSPDQEEAMEDFGVKLLQLQQIQKHQHTETCWKLSAHSSGNMSASSVTKLKDNAPPNDRMESPASSGFGTFDSHFSVLTTTTATNSNRIHSPTRLFSEKQHQHFKQDGFLVVSDLLNKEMLSDVVDAGQNFVAQSKTIESYFSLIEMGMIFQAGETEAHGSNENKNNQSNNQGDTHHHKHAPPSLSIANESNGITDAFRKVALTSVLPQAAAELMQLNHTENLRILRDVFMSKAVNIDESCDWHVDDVGFWPEAFASSKQGINVWIALEDMPRQYQGSMALSPGSHQAHWRHEAYDAIGLNLTLHGGFTKEQATEMARNGVKLLTTCEMNKQAPEIRETIEATKYIPDIRKGDVIFATRSLFHRTVPVTPQGKKYYAARGIEHLNRYSVRYVPGTARLPHGWTFEWSIKSNQKNEGKTLDSAMQQEQENLLWYPRVWPTTDRDLDDRLNYVARTQLDDMKAQTRNDLFELFALFSTNKSEQP